MKSYEVIITRSSKKVDKRAIEEIAVKVILDKERNSVNEENSCFDEGIDTRSRAS